MPGSEYGKTARRQCGGIGVRIAVGTVVARLAIIGVILARERDYAGAMRWFKRAVSRGNSGARLHIAEILTKRGRKMHAIEELTQLIAANDSAAETIEQARAVLQKLQADSVVR